MKAISGLNEHVCKTTINQNLPKEILVEAQAAREEEEEELHQVAEQDRPKGVHHICSRCNFSRYTLSLFYLAKPAPSPSNGWSK
jgi:hypothetical protein